MQGQATDVRIHAEELIRIRELTSRSLPSTPVSPWNKIELDVERDDIYLPFKPKNMV